MKWVESEVPSNNNDESLEDSWGKSHGDLVGTRDGCTRRVPSLGVTDYPEFESGTGAEGLSRTRTVCRDLGKRSSRQG